MPIRVAERASFDGENVSYDDYPVFYQLGDDGFGFGVSL